MGNINLELTNKLYPSLISEDGAVNKTFAQNILATQNLIFLSPVNFVQSIERLEQLANNDVIKYPEIIPFFQLSEEGFADIGLNQITAQSIDKLTRQPLNSFIDSTKIDLSETPSSLLSTLFSRLIQNKLEMRVFYPEGNFTASQTVQNLAIVNQSNTQKAVLINQNIFESQQYFVVNDFKDRPQEYLQNEPEAHFIRSGFYEKRYINLYHKYLVNNLGLSYEQSLSKETYNDKPTRDMFEVLTHKKNQASSIFEFKRHLISKISQPKEDKINKNASISFIVPVVNHAHLTISLIDEITTQCKSAEISFEIILIRNGTTDETKEIKQTQYLKILDFDERLGYPKACNIGANNASNDILCFVNNDIELFPHAVSNVLKHFSDKNIGVVGGKVLYPNFMIQDCGSNLKGFYPISRFRGTLATIEESQKTAEVNHVSGCFLLTRRSLFKAIGGFNELYGKGYFEETEYCMRVSQKNLKVIFEPNSILIHNEFTTFSEEAPTLSNRLLHENYILFSYQIFKTLNPNISKKKNTLCVIGENVGNFSKGLSKLDSFKKSNSKTIYGPDNSIQNPQIASLITENTIQFMPISELKDQPHLNINKDTDEILVLGIPSIRRARNILSSFHAQKTTPRLVLLETKELMDSVFPSLKMTKAGKPRNDSEASNLEQKLIKLFDKVILI